jgi:hypothetical protein
MGTGRHRALAESEARRAAGPGKLGPREESENPAFPGQEKDQPPVIALTDIRSHLADDASNVLTGFTIADSRDVDRDNTAASTDDGLASDTGRGGPLSC